MTAIPSMRPEPERDHYGRYKIGGRPWTRATTVGGALKDLNNLIDWKRRKVAEGMAAAPQLLRAVPAMAARIEAAQDDWREAREAKKAFNALCDQAASAAGADKGSKAGTQAHTLTEYADAGRLAEVLHLATEDELADLEAYLDACDEAGIIRPVEFIERIVINSKVDAAGTLDRIVDIGYQCACGGHLRIADVKSQQNVDFGFLEMCCQLAIYAHADGLVHPETGELEPMPEGLCKCTGMVMHAPVGAASCDVYAIDLLTGWHAALDVAHELRQLRKQSKQLGQVYYRPAGTKPVPRGQALYLIQAAVHPESLRALWRDLSARGQLDAGLKALILDRQSQLAAA